MFDDPFEEVTNLNSKAYTDGYKEGVLTGKKDAIIEGFKIGKKTAFSLAKELGDFYIICQLYKQEHVQTQSADNNDKILRLSIQICDLIDKFDLTDCHTEQFATDLNQIKDKFKQFSSLTNLKTTLQLNTSTSNKFDF